MKIVLHANNINRRAGTRVLVDYARMLRSWGFDVFLSYDPKCGGSEDFALKYVSQEFQVFSGSTKADFDSISSDLGADYYYFLKSGQRDERITTRALSLVHAVFPCSPREVHGDRFAFVSEWLSLYSSNRRVPVVPHFSSLSNYGSGFLTEASVQRPPLEGLTVGLLGGRDSCDIPFVHSALQSFLNFNSENHVLSLGVEVGFRHERLVTLPPSVREEDKVDFIDRCDVMLHGRKMGESFGLSCAEFALRGKSVLVYAYPDHVAHLDYLGGSAVKYYGARSLVKLLRKSRKYFLAREARSKYPSDAIVESSFRRHFILGDPVSGFGEAQNYDLLIYSVRKWIHERRNTFYRIFSSLA